MKVIIPLAGKGTRLRPHTHTIAKPLVHVAGKPVLGYILDELKKVDVDEIIFIIGYLGHQIVEFVKDYDFKAKFVEQKELAGQAHAIQLARPHVKDNDDVLIWFVDTISDADIKELVGIKTDGVIYVKEVPDPRRFGVVETKDGIVTDVVEKPEKPKSNLVNIGLYYVKKSGVMFDCIDELIAKDMKTKGEYFLMDAFRIMIQKGVRFSATEINVWEDCGKQDALLKTNRYLLDNGREKVVKTVNSVIIPPVYIEDGAKISDSVIGPHVSIAKGVTIKSSIVKNSIISVEALVENAKITDSLVGVRATVAGKSKKLNVGDDSEVYYS